MLTVRIGLFALAVPLLMRLPLRRVQGLVEPAGLPSELDTSRTQQIVRNTERMVRLTARFGARRCLVRGLTLYYFLRRADVDLALVFGAGRVQEQFAAHCWLERQGEPYLEATDPRPYFTAMYRFGAVGPWAPEGGKGRA